MSAVGRGYVGALVDRALGWYMGLPPEVSSYTTQCLTVPVESGVKLEADLYQPSGCPPAGTILVRGPYGRSGVMGLLMARVYACRGYQVLFVSSRGTAGSTGQFNAGRSEVIDGQAVVAWMRTQPWYTGSFATLGASYLAYTQWALLTKPPPDLVTCIPAVGPHDFSTHFWGTGAFNSFHIKWSYDVATQDNKGPFAFILDSWNDKTRKLLDEVPLADAVTKFFGDLAPWIHHDISHPNVSGPGWKDVQYGEALDRTDIPVLLVTGYYDLLYRQTIEQYERLQARGCKVAFTVGPWTHVMVGLGKEMQIESLEWLGEHLARREHTHRRSLVHMFDTGTKEWLELPSWPPSTHQLDLFLGPEKGLSKEKPSGEDLLSLSSSFQFDPAHPTPTIGGPLMNGGGSVNDSVLATRPDVLTFTTMPLEEDIRVAGKPVVELMHSSDNPHVDIFMRISEVNANIGRSRNITENYVRLPPRPDGPNKIVQPLLDIVHTFRKGVRLRLYIAGSSHPEFIRNLGTGENPATGKEMRPAVHTVWYSPSNVSRLILPVLA
ncbi:X-Pro dipeptidyl-peptidase-domain-containing protein [Hypoxylon crocopeplum]|nr:X-Pro dipeptidyl-peptidase-domain-containing protein [Hypoxylon crocopeplum]